jgi:hypothetical protein
VVERPTRACVKLMNIEDTNLLDDMVKVRRLAQEMLGKEEMSEDFNDVDGPEADDTSFDPDNSSLKNSDNIDKAPTD